MRGVQRRVLRSREQSLILLAIALIAPLMAIQRLFSGNPSVDLSLGARIAFMLLTVLLAAFAFRVSRSGVVVTEEGVVVKNPLRSQSFRWEEIVCFSLRRRGLFPGLGHVDLQDGRVVPIYGIAAPNALTRPNNSSAQLLITELNDLLSDTRGRQASKTEHFPPVEN